MSFSKELRQWWLRVWGDGDASKASCQKTFYSENKGFYRNCHGHNLYVMVIQIEGKDPAGAPLCREDFMVRRGTNIYGKQSSLYPELAWARRDYKNDKDSFKKIEHSSETHRTRAGDWSTDEYLFYRAKAKEWEYILEHPKDKKPRPKSKSNPKHHQTWVDIIHDGFYGEGQEKS